MRSRYCAFVKQEIAYLKDTTWPSRRDGFKDASFATRAANSTWLGLTVHEVEEGDPEANRGTVTFTARSLVNGALQEQTEKSLFKKKNGRWYYVKPLD